MRGEGEGVRGRREVGEEEEEEEEEEDIFVTPEVSFTPSLTSHHSSHTITHLHFLCLD